MPEDQGELGDLFPLLTQLEKRSLTRVLVQEVGDILHGTAVVLGDILGETGFLSVGRGQSANRVVSSRYPVIVLLLRSIGGGSGGLGLGLGMVLMGGLLVHPR